MPVKKDPDMFILVRVHFCLADWSSSQIKSAWKMLENREALCQHISFKCCNALMLCFMFNSVLFYS